MSIWGTHGRSGTRSGKHGNRLEGGSCGGRGEMAGLLKNVDWTNGNFGTVTHWFVEHKKIYFRPLGAHKRS